jgi:hypothetical protein
MIAWVRAGVIGRLDASPPSSRSHHCLGWVEPPRELEEQSYSKLQHVVV